MTVRRARWITLVLAAGLASCSLTGAPPISYLQLRSAERPLPAGDSPAVIVDAVQLPDYLLRDELLLRDDEYTLHYDPYQRWAEPLDLGIQRVIAKNLEGLLDTRQIGRFPKARIRDADWRLTVEIFRFELDGDRVGMRADGHWRCANRNIPTCNIVVHFDESKPIAQADAVDAGRIAADLSELLDEFAAALAGALPDTPAGMGTSR